MTNGSKAKVVLWLLFFAAITILAMVLAKLGNKHHPPDEAISQVVRIFLHERNHWSVLIQDQKSKSMIMREIDFHEWSYFGCQYIPDVPQGQTMWILIQKSNWPNIWVDFHVHSENDLQGAGWDHGKFGHGQTIPIQ